MSVTATAIARDGWGTSLTATPRLERARHHGHRSQHRVERRHVRHDLAQLRRPSTTYDYASQNPVANSDFTGAMVVDSGHEANCAYVACGIDKPAVEDWTTRQAIIDTAVFVGVPGGDVVRAAGGLRSLGVVARLGARAGVDVKRVADTIGTAHDFAEAGGPGKPFGLKIADAIHGAIKGARIDFSSLAKLRRSLGEPRKGGWWSGWPR